MMLGRFEPGVAEIRLREAATEVLATLKDANLAHSTRRMYAATLACLHRVAGDIAVKDVNVSHVETAGVYR